MRFFGKKSEPIYIKQFNREFSQLPQEQISELVSRYVNAMETEESKSWCKCRWNVHPDDVRVPKGACRECNQAIKDPIHWGLEEDYVSGDSHLFKGVRKRKIDDHPECPVHTREGFLSYFFTWAKKQ